jgi:hypothetical protein
MTGEQRDLSDWLSECNKSKRAFTAAAGLHVW